MKNIVPSSYQGGLIMAIGGTTESWLRRTVPFCPVTDRVEKSTEVFLMRNSLEGTEASRLFSVVIGVFGVSLFVKRRWNNRGRRRKALFLFKGFLCFIHCPFITPSQGWEFRPVSSDPPPGSYLWGSAGFVFSQDLWSPRCVKKDVDGAWWGGNWGRWWSFFGSGGLSDRLLYFWDSGVKKWLGELLLYNSKYLNSGQILPYFLFIYHSYISS